MVRPPADVEHRSEIRRANRLRPIWLGGTIVVAVLATFLGLGDSSSQDAASPPATTTTETTAPASPTSETLTTTAPRRLAPVFAITPSARGGLPFSTDVSPASSGAPATSDLVDVQPPAVVTEGRIAVRSARGELLAGRPGASFTSVACCFDDLHPSNEPHHVWAIEADQAVLVDLDRGRTSTVLPIGGDAVVGPASFGIVTMRPDGTSRWRRPGFDPLDLAIPADRVVLDSGGGLVLVAAPGAEADGSRRGLEVRSLADGALVQSYGVDDVVELGGVLSPEGTTVAVRIDEGWVIRDAVLGRAYGTLPAGVEPVWVGDRRFAGVTGGRLVTSGAPDLGADAPSVVAVAVAERSP